MPLLKVFNFSSGQNSKTSPLFLADSECELVQNYHMDNLGSLTKRNGITPIYRVGSTPIGQIVDNQPILGMFFFNDIQGTDNSNILVATNNATAADSVIYKVSSNAWAISKTDAGYGNFKVQFVSFIDYVFRANQRIEGNSAPVESSNDLITWGTTNCPFGIQPKFIAMWEDRLYALNDDLGPNRSRIYWSSLPSGTPLAITWTPATDYADINPDDGDQITWGEPFGRVMLVFKNKAVYRWTFQQVEADKIIDVGTPLNSRTVKQVHGIVFFANEYGVWIMEGAYSFPKLISKKVEDFIDAITDFNKLVAEVDEDHYYLFISDVTVKGTTYNNCMLVYTLSLKSWHIETYPFEIKFMARFQRKTLGTTEIYDSIYLGDDDGFVYRKDVGTSDYLGVDAKSISGKIITKEYPLVDFPKDSILDNLYVFSQKAAGVKVNYRRNRGEWQAWKDLTQRITEGKLSGRAKTIQLGFTDNSINASQIEGFSVNLKGEPAVKRKGE